MKKIKPDQKIIKALPTETKAMEKLPIVAGGFEKHLDAVSKKSLLIVYHQTDADPTFYFIKNSDDLPLNLYKAVRKLHGFVCNASEWSDSIDKAWAYFSAATLLNLEYLDEDNRFNANRFAQRLLPFRLDTKASIPLISGLSNIEVVSIGFFA